MWLSSIPTNQELQSEIFQQNIEYILNFLNDELAIFWNIPDIQWINVYESLVSRVFTNNNLWAKRKIQLDIIALYLLVKNGYDFRNLVSDLCSLSENWEWRWMIVSDFYEVFEVFRRQKSSPTDLSIELPQIMKDALISKRTQWEEPPAEELQKAVIYFWDEAFSKLQANPEL